jgi:hypothetical protein
MPRRVPPIGFILLGLMLALLGALFALIVMEGAEGGWLPRLLVSAVAALSLLAAEAVWWIRPWVVRTIDAWALTCLLAVIAAVVAVAVHDDLSLGDFLLTITLVVCFVGLPCAVVRWYVRGHAAVAGLRPVRRPLPRPVP